MSEILEPERGAPEIYDIVEPGTYKRRQIMSPRVAYHDMPGPDNAPARTKCVEYTVIGANHSWPTFSLFLEFQNANPHVKIADAA